MTFKALEASGFDAVIVGDRAAVERWSGPLPRVNHVGPIHGLALLEPVSEEPVEVAALRLGVEACLSGAASALVTGPIHKERLSKRGFTHRGHTDFLGELCGVNNPVMAFAGKRFCTSLVTAHLPLAAVPESITEERVLHTLFESHAFLQAYRAVDVPRLVVCGLNPHAGEGGVLGMEELEVIRPACEQARKMGLEVLGPLSAEAAFRLHAEGGADLVVAMYHDQGLAPLKLVEFGDLVNVTLGLPLVRTSVDHGTAMDIAGQGIADARSMIAALKLAVQLSQSARSDSSSTRSHAGYSPMISQV
ncbi:MAG: 4-hydroxythreonine-4-phosphate dehydrogenase PdxA [Myxococcota bacterium]|nr:4-hydroxythreonine-4-phosphate dehydrogenase PdxA [Myxococcota bacterium]